MLRTETEWASNCVTGAGSVTSGTTSDTSQDTGAPEDDEGASTYHGSFGQDCKRRTVLVTTTIVGIIGDWSKACCTQRSTVIESTQRA